jgi:TonB family protein
LVRHVQDRDGNGNRHSPHTEEWLVRPLYSGAILVLLMLLPTHRVFAQDPDPADGPVFVARDVEPSISNGKELKQVLHRVYPSGYRDTGLDVTTILWVYVGSDGSVGASEVLKTSGYDVFDRAAEQVAKSMRFTPALRGDEPVAVWINQAIHFKSGESGRFLEGPALMAEDKLDEQVDWGEGYEKLETFTAREGSARVPSAYKEGSFDLGEWVDLQLRERAAGLLSADRITRLEALPGWTWNRSEW